MASNEMLSFVPSSKQIREGANKSQVTLSEIRDLYFQIQGSGQSPLHDSFLSVLLRLYEAGIIQDKKIRKIGDFWETLGSEESTDRLKRRLSEICDLDSSHIKEEVLSYFASILAGSAYQNRRRPFPYHQYFEEIARRNLKERENSIRCENCGYHFTKRDMADDRREILEDLKVRFANSVEPLRSENRDPLKPITTQRPDVAKGEIRLTNLEIDHLVPEEGFGWSDSDNLVILCKLCNEGKMAYRRPMEALSLFAAGGLSNIPDGRTFGRLHKSIGWATYGYYGGVCLLCNETIKQTELTTVDASSIDPKEESTGVFAPWNLRTACYRCVQTRKLFK